MTTWIRTHVQRVMRLRVDLELYFRRSEGQGSSLRPPLPHELQNFGQEKCRKQRLR